MPKIALKKINKLNLMSILQLEVRHEQKNLVASNAVSIAQAYFNKDAWFRGIYADAIPIGFVMISDSLLKYKNNPKHIPSYFLWRFMIDKKFQGNGYGKEALKLIIEHVKNRPKATEFFLSHSKDDGNAGTFYKKLGFEYTGKEIGDELVMRLKL
ncbi:MAG: GNAT family N-acetyltransferase [Candidatus Hermodarchaeota archaeon]